MYSIKTLVRLLGQKFGLDIRRYNAKSNNSMQIASSLNNFNINVLFDIGANEGQFSKKIRLSGYENKIVSFEPLIDAYKQLQKISKNDKNWTIHPRSAIGSSEGIIEINVSKNSVSSSVLPMSKTHSEAAPSSQYIDKQNVNITTIDHVIDLYLNDDSILFLKIDTQGYESEVMNGASIALEKAQGLIIELSLVNLYDGQLLWKDLLSRIEALGFSLWAIQPGFTHPVNGQTLQMDAIFYKL